MEGAAWNPLRELKERETAYIFEASIMADMFFVQILVLVDDDDDDDDNCMASVQ